MKLIGLLLALLTCVSAHQAYAEPRSHSALERAACDGDGSAEAPVGAPQHPGLLDHYRARPPCKVAGVDYAVGVPRGLVLRDPAKAPWSAPFRYAAAEHVVQCLKGQGVVDGFDFTLHGGMGVVDVGCDRLVIRNSRFKIGVNCVFPIQSYESAPNVSLVDNEIDGGGETSRCPPNKAGEVVLLSGGGVLEARYNWIKNVAQHFLSFNGRRGIGGTIDARFNLEERCGFYQGNHCNGGQIVSGEWTATRISHNTFISDQPDTPLSVDGVTAPTGVFTTASNAVADVQGLVVDKRSSANSLKLGQTISSPCLPPHTILIAPLDRGVSPMLTVSHKASRNGVCPFDVSNAYPSGMVDPIRYVAQLGGSLVDGVIEDNTIIATGPIIGVSYAVYCGAAPANAGSGPNLVSRVRIVGNYIDAEHLLTPNAFSPTPEGCRGPGVTIAGNIDLNTGSELRP